MTLAVLPAPLWTRGKGDDPALRQHDRRLIPPRRGDVFIYKLVGGKIRPWVVLNIHDENVSALALSSGNSAPGMLQSKCRFWKGWIGTTITLIRKEEACKEVTRPYTNMQHLAEIESYVLGLHGATLAQSKPVTIADIRRKYFAG